MSLRFNRSDTIFRTIRELPGIGRRRRTRNDKRLSKKSNNRFHDKTTKTRSNFCI